ncbi:DMT family transporter [Plantactinospora sp. GCM10030261]|uniref:DMT family transporter n=1 Tax=Plantactinospora sp. GCM10030261 TaxID=3273420 RepID=UPI0036068FBE
MNRLAVGLLLSVASGLAVAVQSRINGELGVRLDDGILAAVVSFGLGLLLLVFLVPVVPSARRGMAALRVTLRDGTLRPWHCLGGVCGAFLVAAQGLTVGVLGVAVFTVAVVAGQTSSGLAVDRAGIGPTGRQPVSPGRLVGAALTVLAVLLAVGDRLGNPRALGLAALPALAGVGIAWQQAVNGRVRVASGSAVAATAVNFAAGTVALLAAGTVDVAVRGWPTVGWPTEPWLYLGGPIGIVFIAVAAAVVRYIGVLLLGLATIAGQVGGALLIDLAVPPQAGSPKPVTLVGAVLTLLAVGIAAIRPRAGPTRTGPDRGADESPPGRQPLR